MNALTSHREEKEFVAENRFPVLNDNPLFYRARLNPLGHGSEDELLGIGLHNF